MFLLNLMFDNHLSLIWQKFYCLANNYEGLADINFFIVNFFWSKLLFLSVFHGGQRHPGILAYCKFQYHHVIFRV